MFKSLIRTLRGPSQDPVMAYVSRPLPRGLLDEEVVAALRKALEVDPRPTTLVETLPAALRQVTGRDYQVLDRSVRDVTGAFAKGSVMIREGEVGLWPGYAARAYPLLKPPQRGGRGRGAAAGDGTGGGDAPSPTSPVGKPGWAPPPPPSRPIEGEPRQLAEAQEAAAEGEAEGR
jgi:hypothetical protein